MSKIYQIAIDGPAGAGKSSVAKLLAKKLGITYLDTGAMYRAIGLAAVRKGVSTDDETALAGLIDAVRLDVDYRDGVFMVWLDGVDVSAEIRTGEAAMAASAVSKHKAVRARLVAMQQEIARGRSVVMEGRDICSVVLKDAKYKYFVTAKPEERAKRRFEELCAKGDAAASYERILFEVNARDREDSTRENSPLAAGAGTRIVDTTDMTLEQAADEIIKDIEQ